MHRHRVWRSRRWGSISISAPVELAAQEAALYLGGRGLGFGVVFKAVALEVLHLVGLSVSSALFVEPLGDRIAEDRQSAVALPVSVEQLRQIMASLAEKDAARRGGAPERLVG